MIDNEIKIEGKFKYIESGGKGSNIVLLHGLFGALSNFEGILSHFGKKHNIVIPILPIFEISFRSLSLETLVDHIVEFIEYKNFDKVYVLGNSLGGHLSQLYTLAHQDKVKGMILTGSSGLFESAMGNTFPKRGNYEYIKKKTEDVFYNPEVATKELIDEVYNTANDLKKAMCVVATAKSAVRHNLEHKLHLFNIPTLLVWGIQDAVTPIWVGEKFNELIKDSELVKVDACGHAPMMEKPDIFNEVLEDFINRVDDGVFYEEHKTVRVVS